MLYCIFDTAFFSFHFFHFFHFIRYKILVFDLSLSGCLAFFRFFSSILSNLVAYKIKNVYEPSKIINKTSFTLVVLLHFSFRKIPKNAKCLNFVSEKSMYLNIPNYEINLIFLVTLPRFCFRKAA